jgi:hypothetical protein
VQRQVRRRLGVAQRARPEDADALAAGVANARIADAPALHGAQAPAECLRRPVVVGIEERRVAVGVRGLAFGVEQVVQLGLDARGDEAHVDVDRRLVGAAQEHAAVMAHLGDRGLERMGRVVDAVGAVGKARALGIEVA